MKSQETDNWLVDNFIFFSFKFLHYSFAVLKFCREKSGNLKLWIVCILGLAYHGWYWVGEDMLGFWALQNPLC